MEDLWKLRDIRFRLNDVADRAEYERMLKRFREEEQRSLRQSLLYDGNRLAPKGPAEPEK